MSVIRETPRDPSMTTTTSSASSGNQRRRVPALDGMRGLAVVAVIAYHLNPSWLPGGYLGVDIFFVISGFLITGLLLDVLRPGVGPWPALRDFWARRARRLLPALVVMIAIVAIAASLGAPDAVPGLRSTVPASLLFVANWDLLFQHQSYFQSLGRPPLLQHLWSLGVEEQFYLAWPWLVLIISRASRRPARALCGLAALGAVASAGLMAALYVPGHDASNVYYNTFTHASGLLAGSAAACYVRAHPGRYGRWTARSRTWTGLVGAAGLLTLNALLGDSGTFTYRGGIFLASAVGAVVVLVALRPGPLSRGLGARPLRYLGTRSYSLYLWHWPIICMTRPDVDLPISGVQLLALRLALILAAGEASYSLIEQPFRTRRAQRVLATLQPKGRRWALGSAGACAVTVVALLASTSPPPLPAALAEGSTPAARASLNPVPPGAGGPTTSSGLAGGPPTSAGATADGPGRAATAGAPTSPATSAAPTTTTTTTTLPLARFGPEDDVLAVGDSVLLAASGALERRLDHHVTVDAVVGRQVWQGINRLQRYRQAGDLAGLEAVVVDLGTNGPMTPADVTRIRRICHGAHLLVFVNVRAPVPWQAQTNTSLAAAAHLPGVRLVNWYAASAAPGVLWPDAVHPDPKGQVLYANLVAKALG